MFRQLHFAGLFNGWGGDLWPVQSVKSDFIHIIQLNFYWYGAIAGVAMSVWGTGIMFWGVWLYRCMERKKVGADLMGR